MNVPILIAVGNQYYELGGNEMQQGNMRELLLNKKEIDELLAILNVALQDADMAMRQSHDVEEVAALREHQETIRLWIGRLTYLNKQQ
jgi:hypothetical protein